MFATDVARSAGWLTGESEAAVQIGVRPEHLVRARKGLKGRVFHVEHLGGQTLTHLRPERGHAFVLCEPGAGTDAVGDELVLAPAEGCLHAFDAAGRALDAAGPPPLASDSRSGVAASPHL